jgi:hypothetical protein
MARPTTIKGAATWRRGQDGPAALRLDDLAERIGSQLSAIRDALAGEQDIAVALAHGPSGDDYVLVATRSGLRVWRIGPGAAPHADLTAWPMVRVTPVRSDGGWSRGTRDSGLETHSCEVRVDSATFRIAADGAAGQGTISSFHDEVVRRGTPWHYPG